MPLKTYNLPLILIIIDGFGCGKPEINNAIHCANPVYLNSLMDHYGCSLLQTSGEFVGLPEGQMGNSEVGHMTIGAGRILYQDLVRINHAIETNDILHNEELKNFISRTKARNNRCHIFALLSNGGVHSHESHIVKFIEILLDNDIEVHAHFFLDGRDTSPFSGLEFLSSIDNIFKNIKNFQISTITGRYYAMDRDNKWNRTELAYQAIFNGIGLQSDNYLEEIDKYYQRNIGDEFIEPIINSKYHGFEEDDSIMSLNWRSDRMKQLVAASINPNFDHFQRNKICTNMLTMTEYSRELSAHSKIIFPKQDTQNTLGEVIAQNNLKQLRIAETEKYAHVTFFFDGGIEKNIKNSSQILIPSPNVATYDLKPEMSAEILTDRLIEVLRDHDVVILNFANLDMVGHTGNIPATIKAVNLIDAMIKKIHQEIQKRQGVMVITADHGNADEMFDVLNNQAKTAHTLNPVPFIVVTDNEKYQLSTTGSLADIAPTILDILGLDIPEQMTGVSLIQSVSTII